MNRLEKEIKWTRLLPSMNIVSGELGQNSASLVAMDECYILKLKMAGKLKSKKIDKAYLSLYEKKEIISKELLGNL
ncbi:MAG: hypothetical protein R3Y46_03435 [Opitutales bacterium]